MLRERTLSGAAGVLGMLIVSCGGAARSDTKPLGAGASAVLAPLELAKSGHRLTAKAYEAEGAVNFRYFSDERLGAACAFGLDSQDVPRCFPQSNVQPVYLDGECTEVATFGRSGLSPGDWVALVTDDDVCPGRLAHSAAYRLGEQLFEVGYASDFKVYERVEGRCREAFAPPKEITPVHSLLPEPDAELVAGYWASTEPAAGLRVSRIVADDGAELNVAVTTAEGSVCQLSLDGLCLTGLSADPYGASLDAQCTRTAYFSPLPESCGAPKYATEGERVFELVRPNRLFSKQLVLPISDNVADWQYSCEETDVWSRAYAPGRDVTDLLPKVDMVERGEGVLRSKAWSVGGSTVPLAAVGEASTWFESAGGRCRVTESSDGSLRCLDDGGGLYEASYYSDPHCTNRLYTTTNASISSEVPLRLVEWGEHGINALFAVEPYVGSLYQTGLASNNYACEPALASPTPLWEKGEPIDLGTLPLVREASL